MAEKKSFMVRAIAMGFLGSLQEVGSTFRVDEEAFSDQWMQRLDDKEAADATNQPQADTGLGFVIKHVPAGKYVVLNKDGERVSRVFTKEEGNAKELAQAEAIRLNAGGSPVMPGPSGGGITPPLPEEDDDETGKNLPDA